MIAKGKAAVIGAGVIGVCSALQLQKAGWAVTIYDPQGVAEGASFGNISVIATEGVIPVATPGILGQVPKMLLDPLGPLAIRWGYLPQLTGWLARFVWHSRPGEVERIAGALAALVGGVDRSWRDLMGEAGLQQMLRQQGWLTVYRKQSDLDAEAGMIALRRKLGVPLEILNAEELRQLEPALSRDIQCGLFFPEVSHVIQNKDLVVRLADHFRSQGGDIKELGVDDILVQDDRVTGVRLDNGETEACDALVLAAGAWSKGFAKKLGARLPLDTERGYHITIPDPGVEISRPVYDADGGFVANHLANGLRIGGTVELGGIKAPPNWKRAEVLKERGRRLFPDLKTEGASRWMGFRPSMPDSLPVISKAPGAENAVLAFGHGHMGLTFGARTGELVADLIEGRDSGIDMTPYRADRF